MNKIGFFGIAGLCISLIYKLGLAFGGMAFCLSVVVGWLVWDRVLLLRKVKRYSDMYENIYVVSNHPETGELVDIGKFREMIVNSEYDRVLVNVGKEERWLRRVKNEFFVDEALNDNQRLKVIPIIYQDGEFVNETFKEFRKRVIMEIKEDRRKRHAFLKKMDQGWYMKYGNKQREVIWKRKM